MLSQATEMLYVPDQTADALHARARGRARRRELWSRLTKRSHRLLALAKIERTNTVQTRSYAGIQTVPISQIRGSESRCNDFDQDFNPLRDHNKGRWLCIALARRRDRTLPPVKLIKVGDLYFVRDGHHRISVARAMGQLEIEAEVTVWQVTRRQSLQTLRQEAARDLTCQAGLRGLLSAIGARL